MKTGVKVTDAMSLKPVKVDENTSLMKCAKIMLKKKVGSLIVVSGKKLVGLLTEKDFVSKVVSKNRNAKETTAKDIMTAKLITVGPEMDVNTALNLMKEKNIRRLPVIANDKTLLGLITMTDLVNLQPHLIEFVKEKMYFRKMKKMKQKYMEGECESCSSYGRLYDVDGQLLCEECRDEKGAISEEEALTED